MDLNLVFQPGHSQAAQHHSVQVRPNNVEIVCDLQLWKSFQAGSDVAFEAIYRNYAVSLYGFGLKLTKDKELVKDCIQDLFVEIWHAKHRLASVKSIKAYLFKSIRRKLISEAIKKRKNFSDRVFTKVPKYLQNSSVEASWIENQNLTRQRQKLKLALAMLTDRQKEIIYLKFYSLLSYVEISEVMALTMKGTYKLMGRSIRQLRKHMKS